MAKKEVNTDLWVHEMLKEAEIRDKFSAQGSDIREINEALKSASKKRTGNAGFPEYVGVVKDFLILIEDKSSVDKHIRYTDEGIIADDVKSNIDYAVNGALFYAKHLVEKVTYKKIIAIGISGSEKKHRITPIFVNERGEYTELSDIETLISFKESNIDEYYIREILQEDTNSEKETAEILKDAEKLHNDLRNYGNIEEKNKPLIVSGILLALREIEHHNFSIDNLNGDRITTDGQKVYKAIEDNLRRANVSPEVKKDKLLSQFAVIRDTTKLNEVNETLGKTPIKYFTEFLYDSIYHNIRYQSSAEDYLGRFYGEFMSYSGGDGQNLGIVLTPKHITELFCDLVDIKPNDKVLDPCCGTAGFLIASMHNMLEQTDDAYEQDQIRKHRLFGIEEQSYMFTIATTNMILRGDGKSNLENFTEHLLNSLVEGGRAIVIVPQSSFTGKTKEEKAIKKNILKHHTLEGVITLNKNTFYGVGTNPCIAVFTAGIPHNPNKECKFINFEDDGYEVAKHIGLIETPSAMDKKQRLLDVWFDRIEAETKFCVKTTVEASDEWLHSFYYFNDEIPTEEDFAKTVADYLTFEVNMITHGRGYLFGVSEEEEYPAIEEDTSTLMVVEEGGDLDE